MGKAMQSPGTPWPPGVGDPVRLKNHCLTGKVLSIEGSGSSRTFTVLTDPSVTSDPLVTIRLATTVGRARGTYRLDELEPYP